MTKKKASLRNKIGWIFLIVILTVITAVLIWFKQPFTGSNEASVVKVSPDKLQAYVKTLSVDFHPRSHQNRDNLQKCVDYISSHFKNCGGRVELQKYYTVEGSEEDTYTNVRSFWGPEAGEPIVIGAHYDSFGMHNPGADDNASGVAGLMALAELFHKNPPKKRVELVAYCLEEPPYFRTKYMGSAIHAKSMKDAGLKPAVMICLEMIGFFSEEENSQQYPLPLLKAIYPSKGNFIGIVGRYDQVPIGRKMKSLMSGATTLPVEMIAAPSQVPGIDFSDHLNYWNYDWPAVMITDTSFMRYKHYHEATDTYDRLNYKKMAEVVIMVYEAVKGW